MLIARQRELAIVQDVLDAARRGHAELIEIVGDAGVGKSRLLQATIELATAQGFHVLSAALDPVDRRVPFAALRLALADAIDNERSPRLQHLIQGLDSALRFGTDSDHGDVGEAAGSDASTVVELLARLLDEWTTRRPVLFAIDDVNYCDTDTLEALTFCGRHLNKRPLVVACTANTTLTELSLGSATRLESIRASGHSTEVHVAALTGADLAEYVRHHIGGDVTSDLLDYIAQTTGGVPFYVDVLVESLAQSGRLSETTPHLIDVAHPETVPLSTPTMVLHRVFRLGAPARAVARTMSASGPIALSDLGVLATAAGIEVGEADDGFDELVRAKVLVADGPMFRFTHPIVRSVLYADLGPAEATRIHRQMAESLRRRAADGRPIDVIALARHVSAAAVPGEAWAVDALADAGDLVIRSAPNNAASWYSDAIALCVDAEQTAELQIRRSRALAQAGRRREAVAAADAARRTLGPGRNRMLATSIGLRAMANDGRYDEVDKWYGEIDAAEADLVPRLHAHYAQSLLWRDRLDEAATVLRRTEQLLDGTSDPIVDAVRLLHALSTNQAGAARRIIAHTVEARTSMSPLTWQNASLSMATALAYNGSPSLSREYFGPHDDTVRNTGLFACGLIMMHWQLGEWDRAIELASRLDTSDASNHDLALYNSVRGVVALIGAERGEPAPDELRADLHSPGSMPLWAWLGVAWSDIGQRDFDAARRVLDTSRAWIDRSGRVGYLYLVLDALSVIELATGNQPAAIALSRQLDDLMSTDSFERPLCLAALTRAQVHRDVEAAREANDIATKGGLQLEINRALALEGTLRDDADLLLEAHHGFGQLGAKRRQHIVTRELRRLGRRAPRKRRTGELTDGEMRLVELVAEGHTNRQIAEIACLSPKTVENYLSRIFTKTDCAGRVELAVAFSDGRFDD